MPVRWLIKQDNTTFTFLFFYDARYFNTMKCKQSNIWRGTCFVFFCFFLDKTSKKKFCLWEVMHTINEPCCQSLEQCGAAAETAVKDLNLEWFYHITGKRKKIFSSKTWEAAVLWRPLFSRPDLPIVGREHGAAAWSTGELPLIARSCFLLLGRRAQC